VKAPHAVEALLRRRAAGARDDGARLALAIEGGGMRGAVSAGMAIAVDELGLTDAFDALYGASAGALNGAWLLSGNPSDGLRPYADPGLIRQYIRRSNALRGRPVVDTRHLVEHLYEQVLPMRWEAVLTHRVRFHPLATDVETVPRRARGGCDPRARAALAPPAGLRAPVAHVARGDRHAAAPARGARAARVPRAAGAAGRRRRAAGVPRGGARHPPAGGLAARVPT
jgi:Patatin-like phospholipase